MEDMKIQYEQPNLKISCFHDQDMLTASQEAWPGDGWVKDPFIED